MIVQMVFRQVCKKAHPKRNLVCPMLAECVGGYLHHAAVTPGGHHLPQHPLQSHGVRGGALGRHFAPTDNRTHCADQSYLFSRRRLQNMADEISRGGFSVGAGHSDYRKLFCRMSIPIGCSCGQRRAHLLHLHMGQCTGSAAAPAQDAGRSPAHGLTGVAAPILMCAGNGCKQVSRLNPV